MQISFLKLFITFLQVVDNFPRQLEDLSEVEKFELSEEDYAKRTGIGKINKINIIKN